MKCINLTLIIALLLCFSSCHIGRFFYLNTADTKDYTVFPATEIINAEIPYIFFPAEQISDSISQFLNSQLVFLEQERTTSLLILRNDSIIFEKYFNNTDRNTIRPSFSIAKSYISALIGIAIDEGKILSVDDTITNYFNEFRNNGFNKITIRNLLNMRSGIKFSESYLNPFGHIAKFYYGVNLRKYVAKLKTEEIAGENYRYVSANTQILLYILESVYQKSFPEIIEEKLWIRIGTEFPASWNYDSEKNKSYKGFCCLNTRPVDLLKFGRLYLNNGRWNKKQIISEKWINESIQITNNSKDSQNYPYHYHWRVLNNGAFFAKGILGQFIFVYPAKNIVIVRTGDKAGNINWPSYFIDISNKL